MVVIESYLVGRIEGQKGRFEDPLTLVIGEALPEDTQGIEIKYSVGRRIANDLMGKSLFLSYVDEETGEELLDVVFPDLPEDVIDHITSGNSIALQNTEGETALLINFDETPAEATIELA